MNPVELKACPFCGKKPTHTQTNRTGRFHKIGCTNLDCLEVETPLFASIEDASDFWNTRHEPEAQTSGLDIGQAVKAMKEGKIVERAMYPDFHFRIVEEDLQERVTPTDWSPLPHGFNAYELLATDWRIVR